MRRPLRFHAPRRLGRDVLDSKGHSNRLLFFNTTSNNFKTIISFPEYASAVGDCLEFVSSDTHLVGDVVDGIQEIGENGGSENLRDPNVCSAYFQSTFAGCTNTNDIEMSLRETNSTIATGVVVFPYDLWLRQEMGYSEEDSIAAVEANMLRYLAAQLDLACDDPAGGGIIGLSSNPMDEIDTSFSTCVSDPPLMISEEHEDRRECLPMMGGMTYYLATTEGGAARTVSEVAENDIFNRISIGAEEGSFVGDDVVEVIIVERTTITMKNDGDSTVSWPIIGAILGGALALFTLILLLILLIRRKQEKKRQQAGLDARYPFDVSDWDADSVPEDYAIDRHLGVVYPKPPASPDRTVDGSFTSCSEANVCFP